MKEKIPLSNILSLVAIAISLTAISINIYKMFIRDETLKSPAPFTQEALGTYPASDLPKICEGHTRLTKGGPVIKCISKII